MTDQISDELQTPEDFEVEAFDILETSQEYDEGVNKLIDAYNRTTQKSPELLEDYGQKLRFKFKESLFDIDDTLAITPLKPSDFEGEDVDKISKWEEENIRLLDESSDPDVLAVKDSLKRSIETHASTARRDLLGARGEGTVEYIKDKFFRFGEGVIGPLESLVGEEGVSEFLRERTDPARDLDFSSALATGAGSIVPILAAGATGGPLAATAVAAAQGAGAVRETVEASLEETGESQRALEAGTIEAAGQAIQVIPAGRIFGRLGSSLKASLAGKATGKATVKQVAADALTEASAEGTGQVFSNIAASVGLDREIPITEGVGTAFAVGGILAGGVSGVNLAVQKAQEKTLKRLLDENREKLKTLTSEEELKNNATFKATDKDITSDNKAMDAFFGEQGEASSQPKIEGDILANIERQYELELEQKLAEETAVNPDTRQVEDVMPPDLLDMPVPTVEGVPVAEEISVPEVEKAQGEKKVTKALEDGRILAANPDTIPDNQLPSASPGRLLTFLARAVTEDIKLVKQLNGAFGYYSPSSKKIAIPKALGADPARLMRTFAHEMGHAIDYFNATDIKNKALEPVFRKMKLVADKVKELDTDKKVESEAENLSREWRGDWKNQPKSYQEYRERKTEIFADVVSALFNNPTWVKNNYPELFKAFENGIAQDDVISESWNNLKTFIEDPNAVQQLYQQKRRQERKQEGDIKAAANREKNIASPGPWGLIKNLIDGLYKTAFRREAEAKRLVVKEKPSLKKDVMTKMLNNIEKMPGYRNLIDVYIDTPVKRAMTKVIDAGIDLNTWAEWEWTNKLLYETTPTIENIRQNPQLYMDAMGVLLDQKIKIPGTKKLFQLDPDGSIRSAITERSTEGFIDAMAKSNIAVSTAQAFTLEDFISKYGNTPEGKTKATRAFNLMNARYERLKKSPIRAAIEQTINDFNKTTPAVYDLLNDLFNNSAFNVRRYLVNDNLDNVFEARERRQWLETTQVTPEQLDVMKQQSKEFHDAVSSLFPIIEQSGIVSPEVYERMKLNKGVYVTNQILKYFEGDQRVDGVIRAATGSIGARGNEFAATLNKMEAITERSIQQVGVNSAIKIAYLGGIPVEQVNVPFNKNIFELKRQKERQDKDNSYLIGYKSGVPTLYKIEGKDWSRMTEAPQIHHALRTAANIMDQLTKVFLVRELKTVFNPIFFITQKAIDRAKENFFAGNYIPPGVPVFLSPKLRKFNKRFVKSLNNYVETGKLTGLLKQMVDLGALNFDVIAGNEDTKIDAVEMIYRGLGTEFDTTQDWADQTKEALKKGIEKVPVLNTLAEFFTKTVPREIQFDELRTKAVGFQIGLDQGMSEAEAAIFARERFGTPDPVGGGTHASLLNKFVLFGRAHLNGLRALGDTIVEDPKRALLQGTYRVLLPRMITSPVVMVPLVAMMYGEDEAEKIKKILTKIPSFDKLSRIVIPYAMSDSKGNIRSFSSIKSADEIGPEWRTLYTRLPQDREMTTISATFWPAMEELLAGEIQESVNDLFKGALTVGKLNIHPIIHYGLNVFQLAVGENPTDYFRQKGILSKEVYQGGSLLDKAVGLTQFIASQQVPSFMPYNPFKVQRDPKNQLEKAIQEIPLLGPALRTVTSSSNYGDYEAGLRSEEEKKEFLAEIRLGFGDSTQEIYNEYKRAQAIVSREGKGWNKQLPPMEVNRIKRLQQWHSRVYKDNFNELRAAMERQDNERMDLIYDLLEKNSKAFADSLR